MKVKELMAGDIVKQKHSGLILKVSAIVPPYIRAEGEAGQFHEDKLEPILLTSEILEQNGFKLREGCTSAWDWHNGETSIHVSGNHTCPVGQTLTIYVPGGTVGAAFSSHRAISDLKIRGVHELQHALNLCHIDKEMKVKED